MRAILSSSPGGPETLQLSEIDDPVPAPGQVLVSMRACAINYPELLIIEDRYQFQPARPFAPGSELTGVIAAVGEGVDGWKCGDRVMALVTHGGLAEKAVVQVEDLFSLPENRSFVEGTALISTYGTSFHGLFDRGGLAAGDQLLILGAAGGVGLSAIQLGRAFGARVVAAVSSPEKAQAAREAGADDCVVYGRALVDKSARKALADAFKAAAGPNGFDVILDTIGGDYAEPALRSIAWQGRYLVVGFAAGIPAFPLNLLLLKGCDVAGVFWGAFMQRDRESARLVIHRLFGLWDDGKIAPRIARQYPLDEAQKAFSDLAGRNAIGKLVVAIPERDDPAPFTKESR